MPFATIKTAFMNLGIVVLNICITVITLPYLILDLIFGDGRVK
jgi:hypothetical protein